MNYSEILKQKETNVTNLKATMMARKKSVEELLKKKEVLEKECKEKHGIPLSEVGTKIQSLKAEIENLFKDITAEVNEIEQSIKSFK
jgi:phage host-nuclease inhibitor protein Gam